jgi:hypothetical protein
VAALLAIWVLLFCGVAGTVTTTMQAFGTLSRARADASDALRHLNTLRALVPSTASSGKLSDLAPLLTSANIATATRELSAADADFVALRAEMAPSGLLGAAFHAPVVQGISRSAWLLANAGDQGCLAGLLLLGDAPTLVAYLNGGLFTDSGQKTSPLTAATLTHLSTDLVDAEEIMDYAVADINAANLNAIPSSLLKPSEAAQLRALAQRWSTAQTQISSLQAWLAVAPSLLGVGSPTSYLVEVMDSSELRSGGGFIGNYSIITVNNGRIEPFTLQDVYLLDEPYLARIGYTSPVPAQYSWWPWPGTFGLRDSNLSPDFPTDAQLGMSLLRQEGGPPVQGVIAITPAVIQRILQVVGPIPMPLYGVTVNSDNLAPLIEYYQLAASPQTDLPPSDQISSPGKRFVALLGRALLGKLHGLSLARMAAIVQTFQTDVQQKDAQIYFANHTSEQLLSQTGYSSAVPHTQGDAVTINDANDGGTKAGPFTTVTYQDAVTLDDQGNAKHDLTITYHFDVTNLTPLYGPDRYKTYLRIYTSPGARLTSLTGLNNILGADQIGHGDLTWRQMWGGYVIVSDGVPYTLHVKWTVPHVATHDGHGQWHYSLEYQRQAGATQILDVTIRAPGHTTPVASFTGPLLTDKQLSASYSG